MLAVAALVTGGSAQALQLQRLHVTAFTLSADVARVRLEQPFHLLVQVHVTENVKKLDNLNLPDFFGVEELGDERALSAGRGGTDYREVLTLVAHQSGSLHFTPATLAAIDARDGRPKRFLSNDLTLQVTGGVSQVTRVIRADVTAALRVALVLLAILVAIFIALRLSRSRPAAPAPEPLPVEVPPPTPAAPTARERTRAALARLRSERDRPAAIVLRRELWASIGAREGETLADALAHPAAREPRIRGVLRAAERAAFVNDAYLQTAIDDLMDATERYLE